MKIKFSKRYPDTRPTGKKSGGRDVYILEEDIFVWINDFLIKIPAGFETDYGSVPRGFWNFFPPTSQDLAAATILHDFLCATKYFERAMVDLIFYESMKEFRINPAKRYLIYSAVRIGNYFCWAKRKIPAVLKVRELAGIISKRVPLVDSFL